MAIDRRSLLGRAAGAAAAGALGAGQRPPEAAMQYAQVSAKYGWNLGSQEVAPPSPSMPHLPDEVWELREQWDAATDYSIEHNPMDLLRLRYESLKSVKNSARHYYIARDYQAMQRAKDATLQGLYEKMQGWCQKLGIHNPFGMPSRRRPRDPRYW